MSDDFAEKLKGAKSEKNQLLAVAWLERNYRRVETLFQNPKLASRVFESASELWEDTNPSTDQKVRRTISQVALVNAVIAGLPGKLGIGVVVSIALEFYMAIQVGRRVGVKIDSVGEATKYFGLATGFALAILQLFRQVLSFFFSLFASVAFLPATVLAELFATNLFGVIFWVGFDEAREKRSFLIPVRLYGSIIKRAQELTKFQFGLVKRGFNENTYKEAGHRLKEWLTGDQIYAPEAARGDLFYTVALRFLLQGKHGELSGPIGRKFIQAIRDTIPDLAHADVPAMSQYLGDRIYTESGAIDPQAFRGYESLIRGRMFELMVEESVKFEEGDWSDQAQSARLHPDFNHAGTDIVFTNLATGDTIEVQIKATSSAGYIEDTLLRYPDHPIILTSEIGGELDDIDLIQATNISNEHLQRVTEENFDDLLNHVSALDSSDAGHIPLGYGAATLAKIWPFFAAYMRGRISSNQFTAATQKILPSDGARLARRAILGSAFGALYAWWLLARSVMNLVPKDEPTATRYYWQVG